MANPQMNALQVHEAKIQAAKRSLEEHDGKRIKEDKIQEWALLEISETLRGIHFALLKMQIPRP